MLRSLYSEEHLRDGEVDNCGILFHKEVVLGESFDAKDEVRRQFGQLELFQKVLFVGFVFLHVYETDKCLRKIYKIQINELDLICILLILFIVMDDLSAFATKLFYFVLRQTILVHWFLHQLDLCQDKVSEVIATFSVLPLNLARMLKRGT